MILYRPIEHKDYNIAVGEMTHKGFELYRYISD